MTIRLALATDSFNRANENPLGNGVWTQGPGGDQSMIIATNVATPTTFNGTDSTSYYSGRTWPNDQYSQANLTLSGTTGTFAGIALILRQSASANTRYRFSADHAAANNIGIQKFVAGVTSTIAQITQAWVDGDLFRFEIVDRTLKVFLNGVMVLSGLDTDAVAIASGSPGIGYSTTETSGSLDNWEGGLVSSDLIRDYSTFPKLPFAGVSKR